MPSSAHRQAKVTPLPLIDSRHETASPVPLAKLKRRVITSPSVARALATSAFDTKKNPASAPRPATAAAAVKQTSSRAYERSHVYGSADPGWRVPSKATATAGDDHVESGHDLSDAYMKRTMKQVWPALHNRGSFHCTCNRKITAAPPASNQ